MTDERVQLERERAELRGRRRELAADLQGQDAPGDAGDQSQRLEDDDDLVRLDRQIDEITARLAEGPAPDADSGSGLPDGTTVRLRFDDGPVETLRVVVTSEAAPADQRAGVLTADSPLRQALEGHEAGDTISYDAPSGTISARIEAIARPDPEPSS